MAHTTCKYVHSCKGFLIRGLQESGKIYFLLETDKALYILLLSLMIQLLFNIIYSYLLLHFFQLNHKGTVNLLADL